MKRFSRYHGLLLVTGLLFLLSFGAQVITGFTNCNHAITERHGKPFSFGEYLHSGHFLEATFENWEGAFLQAALFVLPAMFLYRRGLFVPGYPGKGGEAGKPPVAKEDSPSSAEQGGRQLWQYRYWPGLAFSFLFLLSFGLHFYGSLLNYNNNQILKGKPVLTAAQYIGNNQFWFEVFRNWQSGFLPVFCGVAFTIFLRQKGSPQSKPVNAPDRRDG